MVLSFCRTMRAFTRSGNMGKPKEAPNRKMFSEGESGVQAPLVDNPSSRP